MTATPSSEARANEAADERYALLMPELVHPLTVEEIKSTYAEGWLAGAEWKGAQDAKTFERLKVVALLIAEANWPYGFASDYIEEQWRALSGVESSDEGEADGD